MRKILISILITISFFLFIERSIAQIDITNVSVINDLGHVRISWEYTGTDTIYINRDELEILNQTEDIAEITDLSIKSYIDITAQANTKPRAYRISENTLISSDIVSTYYLTSEYDSCLQQIKLNWNDLDDYNPPFPTNDWTPSQFYVNIFEDGILQKIPVSASENEYTIENLLDNTDYTIFIETQWQGQDSTSNSNPINLFTQMPISPDYINAISTVVDGNSTNIKFNIDPNTELDSYKLLKSDSQTGEFDTLETYTTSEYELIANHNNSKPETEINYYKLISINQCGRETTNSNLINNIVLKVEIDDFDVSLNWNNFKENTLISESYEIYRSVNNLEPELIGSFSNFNSFDDNIESLQSYNQFCYYIRAIESGTSISEYSQSNVGCVYLKPKIYIPEAFTPNNDGHNDFFQAVFSFIPIEFDFKIYNRWGNLIFETNDYSKAWDGKEFNRNSAPTGSYIYYLRVKSPNNQVVEQRGNIMVIHP